ncbi:LysE family transporter [Saccharopolyspora taberi]
MTSAFLSGLLAGYGIALPVGAVAVHLVALTARTSWLVGVSAALGVATVDGLYALLAVLGGNAIAGPIRAASGVLPVIAGLVLIGLAARTVRTAITQHRKQIETGDERTGPLRAYATLVGLTALNPATIVYFAALVAGGPRTGTGAEQAVFVVAATAASASWQLLVATGGSVLGRVLTGARGRLWTAVVSGAVIFALGVDLLVR